MEVLSKTEELILLSVWRLGSKAYGVTIRNHMIEATGKKFSIGGIYVPLDRLVRKGFLATFQGEPTPERGGMSKRFYQITKKGMTTLNESKKVYDSMWSDIDAREISKG
jgi:DNA-binding PadR family transcriptional regulator